MKYFIAKELIFSPKIFLMNIKFHLFFITLLVVYIISKDQRRYNMQHCKVKEEFSKANTVSISAPGSIEKASGPSPTTLIGSGR